MSRDTVDIYRTSDAQHHSQWAREPGGRLLLPNTDEGLKRLDQVLGVVILAAAVVVFCLNW